MLTDQGTEFINSMMATLQSKCNIRHKRTTPYHPQTDGITERLNQTLLKILRTCFKNPDRTWDMDLATAVMYYNTTTRSSTGMTPFELMYDRKPRDMVLPNVLPDVVDTDEMVKTIFNEETMTLTTPAKASKEITDKRNERVDQQHRGTNTNERYEVGQIIWIKNNSKVDERFT